MDEVDEEWYKSIVMANKRQNIFLVACLDREIAGFIHLYYSLGRGYIEAIAVKPEFRGMGIGSKLLNEAEKILYKKGIEKVRLNVKNSNLKALSFYLKNGYVIDGVTILMKWSLDGRKFENNYVKVRYFKVSNEELKKIDGIPLTWWSTVTEKADLEIYKYYKCEDAYLIYLEDKFCGAVEFKPEKTLYIDYLAVSYSEPQNSLKIVLNWLKMYAMDKGVNEIIIPIDSTKKMFIMGMLEEEFKIYDTEYRLSKDLK